MLVISVILMRIFGRYIDNNHFWLVAIGTPVVVWIISFGFRMWHWSLQDSKANSFDRHRERWILSETRKARRALQILNMTFITAHKEDKQGSVAVEILKNHSIIISQSDWKGEKGKRLSRIDGAAQAITLTQWTPALLFEVKSRRLRLLRMKAARSETDKSRLQPEMDQLLAGLIALDPAGSAVLCG